MNEQEVSDFAAFDSIIDKISASALCRGVSNVDYQLLPSLFRHKMSRSRNAKSIHTVEKNLMWLFKTQARAHIPFLPSSEIEWLVLAQHHGLPTRLLDWSLSPLVALYFAVQSLSKSDGAVYIYDAGKFKKEESIDVMSLEDVVAFFPSHLSKRVTAQSGMFTIHPLSSSSLVNEQITKVIIPAARKKFFLRKLAKYGVHHATMFPDLDGLSQYLRYMNHYD